MKKLCFGRVHPAALLVATLGMLMVACEGSEEEAGQEPADTPAQPAPAGTGAGLSGDTGSVAEETRPGVSLDTVEVALSEYSIAMPGTLSAGSTTLRVSNTGGMEHGIVLEIGATEITFPSTIASGETRDLLVNLTPGTWEISCPVSDHAGRGMRLHLAVR